MKKYRIVAARPKGEANHLKSEFKTYEWKERDGEWKWRQIGWKSIHQISAFMAAGDEVLTGKVIGTKLTDGAAPELEMRISHNDSKYKISEMPDE